MRRRSFVAGLAASLSCSTSREAWAQSGRNVPSVGFAGSERPLFDAFQEGLKEFGWKPGQNVNVIYRGPTQSLDLIDRVLAEHVDVLVAPGPVRLQYAANRQTGTPLVGIDMETDPVASGFVKAISHSGGKVTGVWLDMPEMTGKLIELLKEVVPQVTRCNVIWADREAAAWRNRDGRP